MKTLILAAIRCSLMLIPLAWSPLQTRADTIAFSVSNNNAGNATFALDVTLGYSFTLSSTVTVTNLGLWDFLNDGLAQSHAVSIWTSTGTQLIQATIPAGTGGTLIDGFRYFSIAPLTLTAGTYTIAEFNVNAGRAGDGILIGDSVTGAPGISYGGNRSEFGFTFPSGDPFVLPNGGYFGPNFEFTTGAPTPDSGSTVSLLGCALLGLAALHGFREASFCCADNKFSIGWRQEKRFCAAVLVECHEVSRWPFLH
jgi:Domain of unknown function (DUF4082)/VPDSG-CTERM motif